MKWFFSMVTRVRLRSLWTSPLLVLLVLCWWCWPTISGAAHLGFRDLSIFYAPLYSYLTQRIWEGEFPQWNPLSMTGVPVLGDSTSGLLYPPRWLFMIPGVSAARWMDLYLLGHVLLASIGATLLGRRYDPSGTWSTLGGVCYALSAPLVQLYCNPPFLVGASWLPWYLHFFLRAIDQRGLRDAGFGAIALSMPLLAGDAQSTAHLGLISVAVVFRKCVTFRGRSILNVLDWSRTRLVFPPLLLIFGFCYLLCASQIHASLSWLRYSSRGAEGKQSSIYNFSVGPWNVLELAAPNLFGELGPEHKRLSRLFAPEEQLWNTSIYCGVPAFIAFLVMLSRMNPWGILAISGGLLSCGSYGLGWVLNGLGISQTTSPEFGGPYWLLVQMLPSYASFRYPAKWLPVLSLGMSICLVSMLARPMNCERVRFRRISMAIALLSGGCLAVSFLPICIAFIVSRQFSPGAIDLLWGPINLTGAIDGMRLSLLHSLLISLLLTWHFWRYPDNTTPWNFAAILTTLVLLDLMIGGRSWINQLPRDIVAFPADQKESRGVGHLLEMKSFRFPKPDGAPSPWMRRGSKERISEISLSQSLTLHSLIHLRYSRPVINAPSSIMPYAHQSLWEDVFGSELFMNTEDPQRSLMELLRWLSVSELLVVQGPSDFRVGTFAGEVETVERIVVNHPLPMVRWYSEEWVRPMAAGAKSWKSIVTEVCKGAETCPLWVDLDSRTLVPDKLRLHVPRGERTPEIQIIKTTAEGLELRLTASNRGWLYFNIFQDGEWIAEISNSQGELHAIRPVRANQIGQSLPTKQGDWTVRLSRAPNKIPRWISLGALAILLVVVLGVQPRKVPQI